jgi:hypothetical protein
MHALINLTVQGKKTAIANNAAFYNAEKFVN